MAREIISSLVLGIAVTYFIYNIVNCFFMLRDDSDNNNYLFKNTPWIYFFIALGIINLSLYLMNKFVLCDIAISAGALLGYFFYRKRMEMECTEEMKA